MYIEVEVTGGKVRGTGSTRIFDVEPTVIAYPHPISRQVWSDPAEVLDLS